MKKNNIKNKIVLFSNDNKEPNWIKEYRLNAFRKIDCFNHPSFGPEIKLEIDLNNYFSNKAIPFYIVNDDFIACDIQTAFTEYKDLIEKYYSTLISSEENRYTILNSTVFESGYFIHVFKNKTLDFPIFNKNINCDFSKNIIIVDENAELNIVDYCNSKSNFRCDCTEIFVEKGAKCRYLNINKNDDFSTVVSIKRALVEENASMEWINVVDGAAVFMGYPSSILKGKNAFSKSTTLSLSSSGKSISVGAKMIHKGEFTKSNILNIGHISGNGELEIRNLVNINNSAFNSEAVVSYKYSAEGGNSRYDNVPRYIVDNDSSIINFKMEDDLNKNINITHFIEDNFIKLSKVNKKYLQELLKKSN